MINRRFSFFLRVEIIVSFLEFCVVRVFTAGYWIARYQRPITACMRMAGWWHSSKSPFQAKGWNELAGGVKVCMRASWNMLTTRSLLSEIQVEAEAVDELAEQILHCVKAVSALPTSSVEGIEAWT